MMKHIRPIEKFCLFMTSCLLFISCTNSNQNPSGENLSIVFDVREIIKHGWIRLDSSKYSVRYVPLETNEHCLIGDITKTIIYQCESCISETVLSLIKSKEHLREVNVILIARYKSLKKLKVQNSSLFRGKFPIYQTDAGLGLPIDELDLPYLLFIDDEKTSKHVMAVDLFPEDIQKYIRIISKKYCHP